MATDMSRACIRAVRIHPPDTTLDFDRFHVVKLMNDKLEDAREESTREKQALKLNAPWLPPTT